MHNNHCHRATAYLQIIIIIIIIGTMSFIQGIYTYIPETNHVPKQYNVAAILSLLFMVPISLVSALALMHFYITTNFRIYYYYYYYYKGLPRYHATTS
jgi:hypothetical protein